MRRYRRRARNKKIIYVASFISAIALLTVLGYAYFTTTGSFSSSANISIPAFAPKVNNSYNISQTINLVNTITNGKSLAPGAEGKFKVDIDFTQVDSDVYYKVFNDSTNIPNNLKFYVDENRTTEFSTIVGTELKDNPNRLAEHYIYWKWIYDNSADSNLNDSLYMNQNIPVTFKAIVSQIVESNTFIVNNYEKPTGRIDIANTHAGNNVGSFNITLDLTNVPANSQYRVYFNNKELSNNLHLYSDSGYQNEISYIQGTYDGINKDVTITVYWVLNNDDVSTLNAGLYYASVLGSW